MYTSQPKKMLIINILDILKKYSDATHTLSQQQIIQILSNEYHMNVDRKAIKANLMNLLDFGYDIQYSETVRINKSGEEESIFTDWYLERDFDDSELRLLIDSLLFSKHIPNPQCKKLIEKLKGLSNKYFESKVRHVCNLTEDSAANKQLFYNVAILDEAIEKNNQVSFLYNYYDIDKKMHPQLNSEGVARQYIVNPYQMVATNGRYYLIANYNKYDNISHYRLDRITDIKLLDKKAKPKNKVKGLEKGLNLPKHMAEHIYMFSGESVTVSFRAERRIVSEIIDWLGKDVQFSDANENAVTVTVKANENAMFYWSMQYGEHIEVLKPDSLRQRIIKTVSGMNDVYAENK